MSRSKEFSYSDAVPFHTAAYLLPAILPLVPQNFASKRMLDVGCGNGYLAGKFIEMGWTVVGTDISKDGIEIARRQYPTARFEMVEAGGDLLSQLNEPSFDLVISTEVVEHLYDPRAFAAGCYAALRPGGRFICSTPYHGYLKNLLIAAANKMDSHANPLWDGGHIKLWSRRTLGQLLKETGFENLQFRGAGRLPWLWMSMVMCGDRPVNS